MVYRYGGDEFFIVIAPSNEEKTIGYINNIKEEIINFKAPDYGKFKLELTFGHLLYDPIEKPTVDEFLERIDQLMYNNKNYNDERKRKY